MFLLTTAFCAYTSPYSIIKDTTGKDTLLPVPARMLRNSLQAKDSLDLLVREKQLWLQLKADYEKLAGKDSIIINLFDRNIELSNNLISNLRSQNEKQEKISFNNELIIKEKDAVIRRKNRAILKLSGITVTLGGTILYLLLKK